MLAGIDHDMRGDGHDLRDVVVLGRYEVAHDGDGELASEAIVEVELQVVGLHLGDARGAVELLVDHLLQVGRRNCAGERALVGVGGEAYADGLEAMAVFVGGQRVAFVAHRHLHRVGHGRGDDGVLGHTVERDGNAVFHLVSLVERHQEPEHAAEGEEEQKNQKLFVHDGEHSASDHFAQVLPSTLHDACLVKRWGSGQRRWRRRSLCLR